ncbi:hypothetical protein FRC10_005992 [Ceratobasidium sp. 414]|nr:hypothetical protein FRC10_005992 [Ceratobasidium sp. 414]
MSDTSLPFSFEPPPGGDISLKSADGVVCATAVFADMFSTATQNDIIELTDDAESVSLMLHFIYPPSFLDALPAALLEKSLRIAQKYDINGTTISLDYAISHFSDKDSPIHSDLIYALCLAATYGLPQTQRAVTEAARHGDFELRDPEQIERLAKAFPAPGAASVIGLLGARCIQTRSLRNLLLGHTGGILPKTGNDEPMMCDECVSDEEFPYEESVPYRPSWLNAWCLRAHWDLTNQPLDQASRVFHVSSLDALYGDSDVCRACIDATHHARGGEVFNLWAQKVENKVKEIFDSVEPLYNL